MIKPFTTNESSERRSGFSRRPILLAKLPYVGENRTVEQEPPVSKPESFDQQFGQASTRQQRNAQLFVDRGHPASEFIEFPSTQSDLPDPTAAPGGQQAPPRNYYRQDAMHNEAYRYHDSRSSHHQPKNLTQVQTKFTSHAGLIVTLILAASAILLLLTIVSPTEPSSHQYRGQFELYGDAPKTVPEFNHQAESGVKLPHIAAQEPLDLFAETPLEESDAESQENTDRFGRDDAFHSAQEPTERLSAKPERPAANAALEIIELPSLDEEPIAEDEPSFPDPSAATYPRSAHPDFDLSLLGVTKVEPNDEEPTPGNPELATLPQANSTLNR